MGIWWDLSNRICDHPFVLTVEDVIDETPTIRTLVFSDDIMAAARPGQFAMVWVPGAYELPMSIMIAPQNNDRRAAFTVRRHGPASTSLYNVKKGEQIAVRGPYGKSFDMKDGRLLLVGGGTGLVPLMRFISCSNLANQIILMMGSKTKSEVFFDDIASEMLSVHHKDSRVIISTDDGSYGIQGRITDVVDDTLAKPDEHFDAVYTCGPELMMYKVISSAHRHGIFAQASLERMMKCGAGLCGSCVAGCDIVCQDGTVFDAAHLLANPEFGYTYRDKSGVMTRW